MKASANGRAEEIAHRLSAITRRMRMKKVKLTRQRMVQNDSIMDTAEQPTSGHLAPIESRGSSNLGSGPEGPTGASLMAQFVSGRGLSTIIKGIFHRQFVACLHTRAHSMNVKSLLALLQLLVVTSLLAWAGAARGGPAEDDRFEQFLTRLGLVDLQAAFLEERLASESDGTRQESLARQLADLYASQLISAAQDAARYEQVTGRITLLVSRYPQAKTPSLEVMLLQADYFRAEQAMSKWLGDQRQTAAREEAQQILDRIAPQLVTHFSELKKSLEQQMTALETLPDEGEERETAERRVARLESVVGRAGYFAGWSTYYAAVARSSSTQADFARADQLFRQLLGVTEALTPEDRDSLGLDSPWRARAVIGWGLAAAAAGEQETAKLCFDWLEAPGTAPEIRDQAAYWRLHSLLNAKQYAAVRALAEEQLGKMALPATSGKVAFCASLARAVFGGAAELQGQRDLGLMGIVGLIKLRQNGLARQILTEFSIQADDQAGFYLSWVQGQQLFEQAEQSKTQEAYQTAAALLEKALAAPDAQSDAGSAGQCRNQLAWCYYRLQRWEEAAKMFERAAAARKAAGDSGAVDAAWMAFVAYQTLAKDQPRFVSSAITTLTQLQRDFPEHEYARRAAYYIGKLRSKAATPAETLASLEKVTSDSPTYLAARFDICQLLYDEARKATPADLSKELPKLMQAVDTFQQAARGIREVDEVGRVVRAALFVVDLALTSQPSDLGIAGRYLGLAQPLAATLPDTHAVAAEFHYRAYQIAQRSGDGSALQTQAAWLAEHARGSGYELAGLVTAAKTADEELKAAGPRATTAQREKVHQLYARLSDLLGDSPEVLQRDKNARIAASKAAQYAQELGLHQEAARRLESLLAATAAEGTKNRDYLRRAAIAHFEAQQFAQALPHVRTLLAGLTKGSNDWFEAKYYQLACLARTDPAAYSQVRDQFRLLYPQVPAPWGPKLAALP